MVDKRSAVAPDSHPEARAWIETRPLEPSDRDALARFFTRLSPESRYRRFFELKPELTPRELDRLTAVDHVGHEAIVAVDQHDGSIVGVCRYVREADRPRTAEVAIAVADDWHDLGIGTTLGERIVRRAAENGLTDMRAFTLAGNRPARALLRRLGFRTAGRDGAEVELIMELEAADGVVVPLIRSRAGLRGGREAPHAASALDGRSGAPAPDR